MQHEHATRHLSIEDKLKNYHDKSARYHEKYQLLEKEKEELKRAKQSLEEEVRHLREQLDAISIASHGSNLTASHRMPYSRSDSSISSRDREVQSVSLLAYVVVCVYVCIWV